MSINSFINELVKQQDDGQIEFLSDFNISHILESICSFLNGEGGWIVIGHTGKKLVGISELTENDISELKENINDRIFPQPLVYVQRDEYGGKFLALVNVLKGARQPYSFDKKYYVRSGRNPKEANPDDISLLLRSSNEYTSTWEKLTTIDATFDDLNATEIERTVSEANKIGKGNTLPDNLQEFLSYFQLFDYSSVKNGAVVLFGKSPTKFLGQCRIRITVLPEGKTGSRYEDTVLIENNLFTSFEKVNDYFRKSLPMISEFNNDNWNRINREKFPSDALDEAIVNAMVHRDYGDMSGDITINIYPDKIEIINSGEMPPDIIKGKSTIEAHHSVLRNPTIAHMFYLRGKMEKLGRGLSLIKERFVNLGLQTPEWSTQSGYTTLTLYGIPKPIEINERMHAFLSRLDIGNKFRREEYMEFFKGDIKERTARLDLQKLVDGGWLTKIGDGPTTSYSKTKKKLPDIAG
ncbi:MAG: ATP-binding protein [Bacteroidota bacterium]